MLRITKFLRCQNFFENIKIDENDSPELKNIVKKWLEDSKKY